MQKSLLILTGHSKGLGRAILDTYLKKDEFEIVGISRTILGLEDSKLSEISIDFGDLDVLENKLSDLFPAGDFKEVILINNAGWIGEIKAVGSLQVRMMRENVNINLLAPMYLTNAFVAAYKDLDAKKIICNISSGAASKPMEGWSKYCSTKAAIAMFTKVAAKENTNSQFRFFSVAPGIVDTEMQHEIRLADGLDFPEIERFKTYKENGDLSTPESVAAKISYLLQNENEFKEVIQDVRDFDLP
ncbi:benzil reductase ((S)-benzoin forming) [Algoriphagus ratkowskyi]|uniref:Benzil reductase ((S)-benzoin forming) n=1 Tax=Algoriphagus ratkowskyi TaxID=57028 RepID=A0A2W7RJH5_9BACT|nr:SDR family NAD(P)-dependent oxidoreductase [Algoriphagus ratkowskyi]PZX59166.1 benzil reductase ((S)-benzoin forming) [Algoriphagus ratkowskyi]TXD77551.1 SDR family NAD(P)-dependent oxidoreductase [Algoriphagus ratkowskyi]